MNGTTDLEALYPFLYGEPDPADAQPSLLASARAKFFDSRALRIALLRAERDRLVGCARDLANALRNGATVFTFGNGGSSTDASASADSLARGGRFPAIALTDNVAVLTALANDIGYERALARFLTTMAARGDIAIAFSTSGTSENLIEAFRAARRIGMITLGFSGGTGTFGGTGSVDHYFAVPSASVHRIQEAQTALSQVLWQLVVAAYEQMEASTR